MDSVSWTGRPPQCSGCSDGETCVANPKAPQADVTNDVCAKCMNDGSADRWPCTVDKNCICGTIPTQTPTPSPTPVGPHGGYFYQPVKWVHWPCGHSTDAPGTAYYFTGYANPRKSLQNANYANPAAEEHWLVVGGAGGTAGNNECGLGPRGDPGVWCAAMLELYTAAEMRDVKEAGFVGVMFDFEKMQGTTNAAVKAAFKAAKGAGLEVSVTMSHCMPYDYNGEGTAQDFSVLMGTSEDVSFISPQMYSGGSVYDDIGDGSGGSCTAEDYEQTLGKFTVPIALPKRSDLSTFTTRMVTKAFPAKAGIAWWEC